MTRFDLSRRGLLTAFGGGLALTQTGPALAQAAFDVNPFRLGVTAGDPLPDGFVIWTRLAPDPLAYGSGMPNAPMAVQWEVAADRGFNTVVLILSSLTMALAVRSAQTGAQRATVYPCIRQRIDDLFERAAQHRGGTPR